jgi:hypothetical protein
VASRWGLYNGVGPGLATVRRMHCVEARVAAMDHMNNKRASWPYGCVIGVEVEVEEEGEPETESAFTRVVNKACGSAQRWQGVMPSPRPATCDKVREACES